MAIMTPRFGHEARLPRDKDDNPIQVLSVEEDTVVAANIASGHNRVALPADADVVEIAATNECKIKFGNSSVDASTGVARVFPLGVCVYKVPQGATHLSVTSYNSSTGLVTVARMY